MSATPKPTDRRVRVLCRVARVRRVNPFHWALLRALEVFAPGSRPGLAVFVEKLHVGERGFLDDAWADLCGAHAVDDAEFTRARLTLEGIDALRSGYFTLGQAEERTVELNFPAIVPTETDSADARRKLTREAVESALLEQAPDALRSGERLVGFRV